jgi:hypothetical protein
VRQMSGVAPRVFAAAAATVALVAVSAASALTVSTTTVKSGRWHGITWEFTTEGSFGGGSYCVAMAIRGREAGRGCGATPKKGITYIAHTGRPAPDYVIGPVVAAARSVQITFFDRPPIRAPTIRTRDRSTRYFAVVVTCPATPKSFVARNGAGRIVARFALRHRIGPRASC